MTDSTSERERGQGPPPATPAVVDVARSLPEEWDDAFAWAYGQRFWNIGCG